MNSLSADPVSSGKKFGKSRLEISDERELTRVTRKVDGHRDGDTQVNLEAVPPRILTEIVHKLFSIPPLMGYLSVAISVKYCIFADGSIRPEIMVVS